MDGNIQELASLVRERNAVAKRITKLIGRPAQIGHLGEYIASQVFDIQLEHSAVNEGIDGAFRSGPLAGHTVNIKFYGKREGALDVHPKVVPGYYLVLTGPKSTTMTSRGDVRPWHIGWVFLFHGPTLIDQLQARGVKIGTATSVITNQWDQAEIYPSSANPDYEVNDTQREMLRLFCSGMGYL